MAVLGVRVGVRRADFPWVDVAEGQVLLKLVLASSQHPACQPITMYSPQCAPHNVPTSQGENLGLMET